ncbi:glycerophosphodiester phosphodiesterase [Haladaptatus sp. NG-WS-4]
MARTSGTAERQSANLEQRSSDLELSTDIDQQAVSSSDLSVIAHRGFAGVYPENTVAAIRQSTTALGSTPEMVEIDVHPTADGEVVVFHDSRLDRLTDAPESIANQPVWDLPFETLSDVQILGTEETIPRLETVLNAIPPSVGVNVEFKNPGTLDVRTHENLPPGERDSQKELWLPFADRVVSTLAGYDHDVLVSSFAEGALAAVREVDSTIPVAAVFAESIVDGFEIARRYECDAIHPPWNMIAGTELFNDEYGSFGPYDDVDIVNVAHEEGYDVNVWTVESWYQATQLRDAGVDGIIADYPNVLRFSDE